MMIVAVQNNSLGHDILSDLHTKVYMYAVNHSTIIIIGD